MPSTWLHVPTLLQGAPLCLGQAFWAGVLAAIGTVAGCSAPQLGMLMPATPAAAGAQNHWDIDKLADQVRAAGVPHVGTWALAYDNTQDWKLAKAISALNSGD